MDSLGKFSPESVPIWRTSSFAGEFGDSHIENTNLQVPFTCARFDFKNHYFKTHLFSFATIYKISFDFYKSY